jgi:UDP-glucose 4-epimerase
MSAPTCSTPSLLGQQRGIVVINVRIGTIWGPLGDPKSPFILIPSSSTRPCGASQLARPPPGYADDGGDRCYVKDCARAIALLLCTATLHHDTYNISSGRPVRNCEFADAITELLPDSMARLALVRSPGAPARDLYLDISRLTADTGFQPRYDVRRGIADCVASLRRDGLTPGEPGP